MQLQERKIKHHGFLINLQWNNEEYFSPALAKALHPELRD